MAAIKKSKSKKQISIMSGIKSASGISAISGNQSMISNTEIYRLDSSLDGGS